MIALQTIFIHKGGRKKKPNVLRSQNGKSRGEPLAIDPARLEIRDRELSALGISLMTMKMEDGRLKPKRTAENRLAGFTLGQLLLRHRQGDPYSIDEDQYDAGEKWAQLIHRHASIMGYELKASPKSSGFVMVSNTDWLYRSAGGEIDDEKIGKIRDRFRQCYDALQRVSGDHGWRVSEITYGVCVDNWPLQRLSEADYGMLGLGLNALGRVMR